MSWDCKRGKRGTFSALPLALTFSCASLSFSASFCFNVIFFLAGAAAGALALGFSSSLLSQSSCRQRIVSRYQARRCQRAESRDSTYIIVVLVLSVPFALRRTRRGRDSRSGRGERGRGVGRARGDGSVLDICVESAWGLMLASFFQQGSGRLTACATHPSRRPLCVLCCGGRSVKVGREG